MEQRASLGFFMALVANRPVRPVAALNFLQFSGARQGRSMPGVALRVATSTPSAPTSAATDLDLVDVDANLLHPDLASDIELHIQASSKVPQLSNEWLTGCYDN